MARVARHLTRRAEESDETVKPTLSSAKNVLRPTSPASRRCALFPVFRCADVADFCATGDLLTKPTKNVRRDRGQLIQFAYAKIGSLYVRKSAFEPGINSLSS